MQIETIVVIDPVSGSGGAVEVAIVGIQLIVIVSVLIGRIVGVAGSISTKLLHSFVDAVFTEFSIDIVTRKAV